MNICITESLCCIPETNTTLKINYQRMNICITESLCCIPETNTTLKINYLPRKIF